MIAAFLPVHTCAFVVEWCPTYWVSLEKLLWQMMIFSHLLSTNFFVTAFFTVGLDRNLPRTA